MLYILLTFDYELFFNKSFYTEEEVLIQPTYSIVNALNQYNIPATFFVDVPSIIKYKEFGLNDYPQMVENQLNELLDLGHDIQLHIHPIWFKANYTDNEWQFDQRYYSLDNYSNYKKLIKISKEALDELVGNNSNYRLCAFRAGGFCLTPESEILCELKKLGIMIDSSVCCGVKMEAVGQKFDWSDIREKQQWRFSPEDGIRNIKSGGSMLEIPIGTYGKLPAKWMLTHLNPKLQYPSVKGVPSPIIPIYTQKGIFKVWNRITKSFKTPILYTLDTLHANALVNILKYYDQIAKQENCDVYICAIGHPKFSSKESIVNMCQFIDKVNKSMNEIRFITMQDAYNMLMN